MADMLPRLECNKIRDVENESRITIDDVPSPPVRRMVTSMGIRHAKPYTLRGGPSTKLERRSDSQTHVLHLYQGLPAKIEIVVIQGLETQQSLKELFDLNEA
ncbi:hypothetical protein Tco_0317417 [Tanacetum coccineum]